ncbi:MAG: hypothetical protein ABUL48_05390 [Pseudorhodoplanes sp.]
MRNLRSVCFAVFLVPSVLMGPIAHACLGPSLESSIFFDEQELKAGIDGPAIAKVTITALTSEFVGIARVDKVIKGEIDRDTIVVTVLATYCTRGFGIGASGIVVGSLKRNAQGELVLTAIEETNSQRRARMKAHSTQGR